jgi:hypothetical protein
MCKHPEDSIRPVDPIGSYQAESTWANTTSMYLLGRSFFFVTYYICYYLEGNRNFVLNIIIAYIEFVRNTTDYSQILYTIYFV